MIAPAAARASPRIAQQVLSRRAFHATRARFSSPYHYPEGPYSNLPFNTKTRFFGLRYWAYMATGFFLPFGIASASHIPSIYNIIPHSRHLFLFSVSSAERRAIERYGKFGGGGRLFQVSRAIIPCDSSRRTQRWEMP